MTVAVVYDFAFFPISMGAGREVQAGIPGWKKKHRKKNISCGAWKIALQLLILFSFVCQWDELRVQIGIFHVGIKRKHGSDDVFIFQPEQILIHTTGRECHQPVAAHVV